jgi:hypothetical protein
VLVATLVKVAEMAVAEDSCSASGDVCGGGVGGDASDGGGDGGGAVP